ncbi:hypothetical protein [Nocardia brasiliensis]|uniref:hypothetical protein n=1 Tax=Nocardia brasiliensis TaxID=37326 RepID=UPI0024541A2C|nr:hypothetical protein [Nocardia brasiliensis]
MDEFVEAQSWQLIVQLPRTGAVDDIDVLQELEVALETAFARADIGVIDGNDFGYETMNVFGLVRPSQWVMVVEEAEKLLRERNLLEKAVIARRDMDVEDGSQVVRPDDYTSEFRY